MVIQSIHAKIAITPINPIVHYAGVILSEGYTPFTPFYGITTTLYCFYGNP